MEQLHPDNRHIRDKIRQQLQVLRDTGFLTQPERGIPQIFKCLAVSPDLSRTFHKKVSSHTFHVYDVTSSWSREFEKTIMLGLPTC